MFCILEQRRRRLCCASPEPSASSNVIAAGERVGLIVPAPARAAITYAVPQIRSALIWPSASPRRRRLDRCRRACSSSDGLSQFPSPQARACAQLWGSLGAKFRSFIPSNTPHPHHPTPRNSNLTLSSSSCSPNPPSPRIRNHGAPRQSPR